MLQPTQPGRLGTCALIAATILASACTGDIEERSDAEVEQLRLGRVHVLLEPGDPETGDDFEVTARFAYVRGLDEEFVRARIDMPELAAEVLQPGDCVASDQLAPSEFEAAATDDEELLLVDAGDLRVAIGEESYDIPLSLVPDLLPNMSGVEYLYYGDTLPSLPAEGASLVVEASGSQTDELPPFATEGRVPADLLLEAPAETLSELRRDALVLRWDPQDEPTITLRISGLVGGAPAGADVTCVVPDVGEARLRVSTLRGFGLPFDAQALQVVASRTHTSTFDAGDFAGSELVVERRDPVIVPLP